MPVGDERLRLVIEELAKQREVVAVVVEGRCILQVALVG